MPVVLASSGIEVGSNGSHPSSNAVALEAVGYSGVPAFGGSAATGVQANEPRWATLLSGTPSNHAELVELLKAGNFWAVEIYPPGVAPRIARSTSALANCSRSSGSVASF